VVVLLPRQGPKVVAIGLAVVLFALAVLAQTHPVVLNYRLHLDFDPAWRAVGETQFLLSNWHLLWYAAIIAALLAWRQLAAPSLANPHAGPPRRDARLRGHREPRAGTARADEIAGRHTIRPRAPVDR